MIHCNTRHKAQTRARMTSPLRPLSFGWRTWCLHVGPARTTQWPPHCSPVPTPPRALLTWDALEGACLRPGTRPIGHLGSVWGGCSWHIEHVYSVAQSTLCDPMDPSPPGSSVYGISQARILEQVAIPFSRGSSWPRDRTQASYIASRFFTLWARREVQ